MLQYELMFARSVDNLEAHCRDFDENALSPSEAVRTYEELGAIVRAAQAMLAKTAKRVNETGAHSLERGAQRGGDDRSLARACERPKCTG